MDPSGSGTLRSPVQPLSTAEDPPIGSTSTLRNEDADAQHLARFEFSDQGTKILMVEWYPGAVSVVSPAKLSPSGPDSDPEAAPNKPSTDTTTRANTANDDDSHPDPAGTQDTDNAKPVPAPAPADRATSADASVPWEVSWAGKSTVLPVNDIDDHESHRRVYFLLPPGAPIPATITVTAPGRTPLTLKPLPAIFPEDFSPEAGTRGVLHTIWAKKRLSELEAEMDVELRTNAESVGLEMALTEKQWIIDNFLKPPQQPSPIAARSTVGGRLGDKLKGLKLATSPADLMPGSTANTFTQAGSQSQTLSPQGADIAVPASSFSAISRGPVNAGPISLDAALHNPLAASAPVRLASEDIEDDLFALPLSPRSPDMKKSPFSAL